MGTIFKIAILFIATFCIVNASNDSSEELDSKFGSEISSVGDPFRQFIQEFLDRIESMRSKIKDNLRPVLDRIKTLFFKLGQSLTTLNVDIDSNLNSLTSNGSTDIIEKILKKSQVLFDVITKFEIKLYNLLRGLNQNEISRIASRVLYVKAKIYFALYRRLNRILERVIGIRSFPRELLKIEEIAYDKLAKYLDQTIENIGESILDAKESDEGPSNIDITSVIKFSDLYNEAQSLRFEEFRFLVSKNINADDRVKATIVKLIKNFENLLEIRIVIGDRFIKDHPNYVPELIKIMKKDSKLMRKLIKELDELAKIIFSEDYYEKEDIEDYSD